MIDFIEAGNRSNPVLLLMHGIGGDAESFRPQLDALSDRWRVVAWNMPGYGASPLPDDMQFDELGNSVNTLFDQLGVTHAHVLGHSIGGMVAQQFIAENPERVRSLILSATSPAFGKNDGEFQKKFIAARLGALDAGKSMSDIADGIVDTLTGDDPDPRGVAIARDCMRRVPEATYRAAMHCLVTFDRRDNLARIHVPTLLVAGENDGNAPAAMMEKMSGYINGAQYQRIDGAGHLANLERPAVFNQILRSFLNSVE